ncbi:hypothetical protein JOE65_000135 [Arthrobacter roseus]|nr:hypothetical protein [Arthrobacter roseus]
MDHAVAFAKLLVKATHEAGLAASQKNTPELATVGKQDIGFDFVTTEECDRYSECTAYAEVYGKHVLDIEYTDDLRGDFFEICSRDTTPQQTVLRDRDLAPRGTTGHISERC